jgi:hypothetical protein
MNFVLNVLQGIGAYLTASTRYTALGATSGAVMALAAPWLNVSQHFGFLMGFCIPLAPVYFYLTHPTVMRRRLDTLLQWQQAGLITVPEYRELKRQTLRWYSKRLYGRDGEEQSPASEPAVVSDPGQSSVASTKASQPG